MWSLVMSIATFRLHTASLLQAMRSTGHALPYKARCSAVIGWFSVAVILAVSANRSLGGLPSYGSSVVVLIVGIHASGISIPLPLLMLFGVKSYVNRFFDPASVTMRITINKLYFIPKQEVSSVVGVL